MTGEFCVTVRFRESDARRTAGAVHWAVACALGDPSQVGVDPRDLPTEYTIEIYPSVTADHTEEGS